ARKPAATDQSRVSGGGRDGPLSVGGALGLLKEKDIGMIRDTRASHPLAQPRRFGESLRTFHIVEGCQDEHLVRVVRIAEDPRAGAAIRFAIVRVLVIDGLPGVVIV